MTEFWRAGGPEVAPSQAVARQVEAEGWDGQMFMDSQSLSCDPWVAMAAWATATEHLGLATGVTNSLTRHPAVTAACAASVQALSGGRTVLGIGRGDSALAYLGQSPDGLKHFEKTLYDLQRLLRGEETAFPAHPDFTDVSSAEHLSLARRPAGMRLNWLPEELPKVPLDVAATGPRVISLAAPVAERVTFSVGAQPERVAWALDLARMARRAESVEGRCSYGVQIIVVCHTDRERVREAVTGFVAPLARFQVIQGNAAGPQSEDERQNFAAIRRGYDMTRHGDTTTHDRLHGEQLSWDFVQRFAVVGPPDHCIERLLALMKLGIERFVIVGPGFHPEANGSGPGLFVSEVLPTLREEGRGNRNIPPIK